MRWSLSPFQPWDVTLLSANLLAGTIGVTGLGVIPRKQRELRSPIAAPPSSLHGAMERNGSSGGSCMETSALCQVGAIRSNLLSSQPQSGSLLLPLATDHRDHQTFPNRSLPGGMPGSPGVPSPVGSHDTGLSVRGQGQPQSAWASWSPTSWASWQITSEEKYRKGRKFKFCGDFPAGGHGEIRGCV